jgi:uncharacterized protein (TIGR04255 family)
MIHSMEIGPDEVYPNSPLQSVVFEIRFPGEPAVEAHRDAFFEKVRSDFPQVFVPRLTQGEAVALAPYHFVSLDNQRSLLTALNSFAFRTGDYRGFRYFRDEVLKYVRLFAETYTLSRITRTGLRYINLIPFAPGGGVPVTEFFRLSLSFGDTAVRTFGKFYLVTEFPSASGSLTIQLGTAEAEPKRNALILDFDFAKIGDDLTIDGIDRYLEESHAETKKLFESLLTDQYRSYLRGEVLK